MSTPAHRPQTAAQPYGGELDGDGAPVGLAAQQPADSSPAPPSREPPTPDALPGWNPWTAPLVLFAGLLLAAIGAFVIDAVLKALGVHIATSNIPPGVEIGETAVQDAAFVIAAVTIAGMTGRRAAPWQFGLRIPRTTLRQTAGMIVLLYVAFVIFTDVWEVAINQTGKEQLLNQLGANQSTTLLVCAAVLTCVIAPFCEEFLFRGYIFTALRNWRGPRPAALITGVLFGLVHIGSAPASALVPLGALGFGLCLLYWRTRSLLPCIATHSINNSIAFGLLESWNAGEVVLLTAGALAVLGLVALLLRAVGLIYVPRPRAAAAG